MSELILGINVFGHDSSVSLLDSTNCKILYCLTEERFSNVKHDGKLPVACLARIEEAIAKENLGTITHVATNLDYKLILSDFLFVDLKDRLPVDVCKKLEKAVFETLPFTVFYELGKYPATYYAEILRKNQIDHHRAEEILIQLGWSINHCLKIRSFNQYIRERFPQAQLHHVSHHMCHVASVFFTSKFKEAALLTIDGQGEAESMTLGFAQGNSYEKLSHSIWPHSVGSLFMDMTAFLGFTGSSNFPGFGEEYKVMGMAAYGKPSFVDIFRSLGHVSPEGKFAYTNQDLIRRVPVPGCPGHFKMGMTEEFERRLGGSRKTKDEITQRHFDIAASLQAFIEETGLSLAKVLRRQFPKTENICVSGGVALNGLMNMKILQEAGFKNIYIFPASGDDGTSLGAALYVHGYTLKRTVPIDFKNAFLGLDYSDSLIEKSIQQAGLKYEKPANMPQKIAQILSQNLIVARALGRAEFGPRALGHRSIMANPGSSEMKEILNLRIKHREPFRPFAPACLVEEASRFFEISVEAPYMLLICQVKEDQRSKIPAVVHQDFTARVQTVERSSNPDFYQIIEEFNKITGVPVVMNTSYNVNGEAITETPQDSIEAFLFMDIDYLAIGDFLISKKENQKMSYKMPISDFLEIRKNRYRAEFREHENFFEPSEFPGSGEMGSLKELVKVYKKAADERLELIERLHVPTAAASVGWLARMMNKIKIKLHGSKY